MSASDFTSENPELMDFTIRACVIGPHPEIDEHQKWVEWTATLVEWPVRIEVGLSKAKSLMAPNYGSFDVIARITASDGPEAGLMMVGLCSSSTSLNGSGLISIDHMEIAVPLVIQEEP